MTNNPTPSVRLCASCQSTLIVVSQVTEEIEGSRFPQTTTVLRCSNQECQDERDKQAATRLKLRLQREEAERQRAVKRTKNHATT